MSFDVNDFEQQVKCFYKNEHYSVRDNGAVFRHVPLGKRPRVMDDQWTFGKLNNNNGYLEIASARVHRIVATAFYGEPPTPHHVVDHKDTNKMNNRPQNLRWVTRLENVLLNPITAKRIAKVCGSVEAFLANPSKFRDLFQEPTTSWMRTVTEEEAQISLERMLAWAANDSHPTGGSLGEWIFNRSLPEQYAEPATEIITAKTTNALQKNWKIASEFPCCPVEVGENPIADYSERLIPGLIFCRNETYTSIVFKSVIDQGGQSIFIITQASGLKPWALAKIVYENGLFVHENLGNFFRFDGVEKYFTIAQGEDWTGGDTFDDNC